MLKWRTDRNLIDTIYTAQGAINTYEITKAEYDRDEPSYGYGRIAWWLIVNNDRVDAEAYTTLREAKAAAHDIENGN